MPWKQLILGASVGDYLFESYLNYRQYQVYKKREVPVGLQSIVTQEKFIESNEYSQAKAKFSFVRSTFGLVRDLVVFQYDLIPKLFHVAKMVLKKTARLAGERAAANPGSKFLLKYSKFLSCFSKSVPVQSALAFYVMNLASTILSLPFAYYHAFVLEEQFGFNKMTKKTFFLDFFKGELVSFLINSLFIGGFEKILQKFGLSFVPYLSVFIVLLQITFMFLYPTFIMPMFNKFTKLDDGELKTKAEALANKLDFPLTDLYVIDGSSRSAHSNAFFIGLPWKKQIVLYDTLIDQCTTDEIISVLGHELGHWKKNHIVTSLVAANANILVMSFGFLAFAKNDSFYDALGFFANDRPAAYLFNTLYGQIMSPLQHGVSFAMQHLSRKLEFEADEFSKDLGYGDALASSLITMNRENLSNYDGDWLYNSYKRSHPLLIERLNGIGYKPKSG